MSSPTPRPRSIPEQSSAAAGGGSLVGGGSSGSLVSGSSSGGSSVVARSSAEGGELVGSSAISATFVEGAGVSAAGALDCVRRGVREGRAVGVRSACGGAAVRVGRAGVSPTTSSRLGGGVGGRVRVTRSEGVGERVLDATGGGASRTVTTVGGAAAGGSSRLASLTPYTTAPVMALAATAAPMGVRAHPRTRSVAQAAAPVSSKSTPAVMPRRRRASAKAAFLALLRPGSSSAALTMMSGWSSSSVRDQGCPSGRSR